MAELNVKIITGPTAYPVTLAEMKSHLNLVVAETEFDDDINAFIESAVDESQGFTGLFFMNQTGQIYADEFSLIFNFYGIAPIHTLTSIEYKDVNGQWQTLAATEYFVDLISGIPRVKIMGIWPDLIDDDFNRVRFNVGLGLNSGDVAAQQSAVPGRIKQAIKLRVARHFQTREDKMTKAEMIHAADQLLFPFKTFV